MEAWNPALERRVFGTDDPYGVAALLEGFTHEHIGQVEEGVFYRPGVGVVAGLRLLDGREVVVKVHRWNVSIERLSAIQEVQRHLRAVGLPTPLPIVDPTPLADGIATVEELRRGDRADGHDPAVRTVLARGLHRLLSATRVLEPSSAVGAPLLLRPRGAALWPEPHDVRFDFERTSDGAEWIDDVAVAARARLDRMPGEAILGHFDWRVENLGFKAGEISAIYDWDSLAAAPEPVVVGNTAAQFTADWRATERDPLPALDEMRAFVEEYERARGRSFGRAEREALDAANLLLCAYGARCQHSDLALHPEIGGTRTTGWLRLLRERGDRALVSSD